MWKTSLWRFWCAVALVVALVLGVSPQAGALNFTETFDSWNLSQCNTGQYPFGPDCFSVFGCPNNKNLFVRRLKQDSSCLYSGQVKQWALSLPQYHNGISSNGTQIATLAGTPPYAEILSSRSKQAGTYGYVEVIMQIHGPGVTRPSGEHYVLLGDAQLSPWDSCPNDCSGDNSTRTQALGDFIGAIWGNFGNSDLAGVDGCEPSGFNCLGFVAESTRGTTTHLDPQTFIKWPLSGDTFPGNTWYRIRYTVGLSPIGTRVAHTVKAEYWNGSAWQLIGERYNSAAPSSFAGMPLGYVGVLVYAPTRDMSVVHWDWDNFKVSW